MITRKNSKKIRVGNTFIGGFEKITVQSMLNKRSTDIEGNVRQAVELEKAGCDIIRVAIPDEEAIKLIPAIKNEITVPLVADIHFDYKLAVKSAEVGIDKIRINPGNIGSDDGVRKVVEICKSKNLPIRIGVNSGSISKQMLEKYGGPTSEALCESAMYHVRLLEKYDFDNIVISLKSSDVVNTVESYRLISEMTDYPLHLGVTESGSLSMGTIKSSIGIGSLLVDGIGDTIRVSLTADPVKEVKAGKDILKAIGLGSGVTFISCPTCGRTRINLFELTEKIEKALEGCNKNITVAIMGCAVNGPGEAREADIGVAGGNGEGIIFKKGKIIEKVREDEIISELLKLVNSIDIE
jgi:(E)-4-hydroxy-3-methylbut-2-enyl-diphosphate synthase